MLATAVACQPASDDPAFDLGTGPAATPAPTTATTTTTTAAAAASPPVATLLAAGDIASCDSDGDEATAALVTRLLSAHPGALVATLGDNVYDAGTRSEFAGCYDPTWGRFKDSTRPAIGNHDYGTAGAAGYRSYFGISGPTWYSYDLGSWHVVVLDSNCGVVGCGPGSEQHRWLRSDLAAHPASCTLAYWHHPRFSSGSVHGSDVTVGPLFDALATAGADVVLTGHEHHYERFAPVNGVRQFVVGTGGRSHYGFGGTAAPGSEVRHSGTYGVLQLTLRADGYDWRFVPVSGETFSDAGSALCQ